MLNARTALSSMRRLPIKDFETGFGAAPILVVAPHPDDESLGCGGMIAEACERGLPPIVAILTDGSMSHPNSSQYGKAALRSLRERETIEAVGALGLPPDRVCFLRYPDTAAPSQGLGLREAAARLSDLVRTWRCGTIAVSWKRDPHCDHEAAALIAERACIDSQTALLAYPVWGWTLPPDSLIDDRGISGFRLDITRHLSRKRKAIFAHASQYAGVITDDPTGFQMSAEFIDHFMMPTEVYIELSART